MSKCVSRLLAATFVLLLPTLAAAQTSAIAGEVKDTSGAVLPGVTVEVTSPALIEKVRTAVTDDADATASSSSCPAFTPSPSRCPGSAPCGARTSS